MQSDVGFAGRAAAERTVAAWAEYLRKRWSHIEPKEHEGGTYDRARPELMIADLRWIAEDEMPKLLHSCMYGELRNMLWLSRGILAGAGLIDRKEAHLIGLPTPDSTMAKVAV